MKLARLFPALLACAILRPCGPVWAAEPTEGPAIALEETDKPAPDKKPPAADQKPAAGDKKAASADKPAPPPPDVRNSVVKIFANQSAPNMFMPWKITTPTEATGSGVIIEGGRILTNAHVVNYSQQIYVQPNESSERLDASIEFISADCDLAVLKLDEPEAIADRRALKLAERLPLLQTKINVLGYPTGGDTLSVTEGVVSRIEYVGYYQNTAALRIQVDAAVNPGNSGGPGIIDEQITGIVFSKFAEGESIGYLIPAEVIRHFLDDWADGKYDGFPKLLVRATTLENPDMRSYLKLERSTTGALLYGVDRPDLADKLKDWDIITAIDGVAVDNLCMVSIGDGLRVQMGYLISKKTPGAMVKLDLVRAGEKKQIEVPTVAQGNQMIQAMPGKRPTYFIYGGLAFAPVTTEMATQAGSYWAHLGIAGSLLTQSIRKQRSEPTDEVVVLCSPIIPHRLTKGYDISPLSVLTHVNDQPVKNLRQMIGLIKANKQPFIIFRFEDDYEEKVVLDPKRVAQFTPEILSNNNIPSVRSEDLKDVWPE